MRASVAGVTQRDPPRGSAELVRRAGRHRELTAGLATAIVIAQLLFAPVVLIGCLLLASVGQLSRWRPYWLALPGAVGLAWLLQAGLSGPASGLAAGSRQAIRLLSALAAHPDRLASAASAADPGRWLAAQLPLALLAASAEAAVVLRLAWRRSAPDWRPGMIAAARRRLGRAAVRAGEVVTRDGFAVGLHDGTGRLAGLSWAWAEGGLLVTGADLGELADPCLAAACAALRRRKTLLIADLSPAGPGSGTAAGRNLATDVTALAGRLGIAVAGAGTQGAAAAIGQAIRGRTVLLLAARSGLDAGQLVGDLTGVLASMADLGLRADCLAVITGCEAVQPGPLTALLGLGPVTGTGLLLATANPAAAASLWPFAGAVVVAGPVSENLALQFSGAVQLGGAGQLASLTPGERGWGPLAAARLGAQPRGRLTLLVRDQLSGERAAASAVTRLPIEITRVR